MSYLLVIAAIPVVGFGLYKLFFKSKKRPIYPKDVVCAHIGPRGPFAPSLSPFSIKLELFMKLTNIKYEPELEFNMSSKGKFPWISYNEDDVTDSQLSIEYMKKTFDVNLNQDYSPAELAVGRAMQKMVEENLYWALVLDRWVYKNTSKIFEISGIPSYLIYIVSRDQKKNAYGHGLGRHTEEEVLDIGFKDLKALSDFLGTKKYLLGEKISECDCATFGLLCQIYYHSPEGKFEKFLKTETKNLCDYLERIKEDHWPSWDDDIEIKEQKDNNEKKNE